MKFQDIKDAIELLFVSVAGPVVKYVRRLRFVSFVGLLAFGLIFLGEAVAISGGVGFGRTLIALGWGLSLGSIAIVSLGVLLPLKFGSVLTGRGSQEVGNLAKLAVRALSLVSLVGLFMYVIGVYSTLFLVVTLMMFVVTLGLFMVAWPGSGALGTFFQVSLKGVMTVAIFGMLGFVVLGELAPDRLDRLRHWSYLASKDPVSSGQIAIDEVDFSVSVILKQKIEQEKADFHRSIGAPDENGKLTLEPNHRFQRSWTYHDPGYTQGDKNTHFWDLGEPEQLKVAQAEFAKHIHDMTRELGDGK